MVEVRAAAVVVLALDLLHLLEGTFNQNRVSANTSPNPNFNPHPKVK